TVDRENIFKGSFEGLDFETLAEGSANHRSGFQFPVCAVLWHGFYKSVQLTSRLGSARSLCSPDLSLAPTIT
ncbi:MAG: hypothetical protein MUO97_02570, partial [Dehalococcoidia bacterium]|nr:hypothetical protein [Dehalococcoidia bacterium]